MQTRSCIERAAEYQPTSRRPGRRIASSIMSFLLVIPMMRMLFRLSTPSILDSSWLTILSETPVESTKRKRDFVTFFTNEKRCISFTSCGSSALHDGVHLIEYYNVQHARITRLL